MVTIIAEIGINHNQNLLTAKHLIESASHAGADYIKTQLWHPSTFPELEGYRISRDFILEMKNHAALFGIKFFATAFDNKSLGFLTANLINDAWKIPSNKTVTSDLYLVQNIFRIAASNGQKVFFSTGSIKLDGIALFKNVACHLPKCYPKLDITWLHCVSKYPCPENEVDYPRLSALKEVVGDDPVGYSDHSLSTVNIPLKMISMGAEVIEKHITQDKNQPGPDHKASLEPWEFGEMVQAIRNIR